ncbi:hypothetical protein J6590_042621 [Homalodisca vitripennis]|nr:hypothetical protein J6590_042621 [Homalodisca vitripennis]
MLTTYVITVAFGYTGVLFRGNKISVSVTDVHLLFNIVVIVYTCIRGIYDHRTKLSASLTLCEIENQTGLLKVTGLPMNMVVTVTSIMVYMVHFNENCHFLASWIVIFSSTRELFYIVTEIYFNIVKCNLLYGCLIFMAVWADLQGAVNKQFRNLRNVQANVNLMLGRNHEGHFHYRRLAWVEDMEEWKRKLGLLRSTQGSLSHSEHDIRSCYWMYVAWFAVVAAVWSPTHLIVREVKYFWSTSNHWFHVMAMNTYVIIIILSVTMAERMSIMKKSTQAELSNLMVNCCEAKHRMAVKLQLLSHHHRSSPFSSYIFDVNYTLLETILDSTLMIVCVLLGN